MSGAGLFWQLATCVCQPYCFPALLVSLLVSYLVPHLVLIIRLLPLYNSLCFSVRCQTVVVFSACTDCIVLLTSVCLVRLQCSLLFFVFLCIPLCASSYRGLPPLHLPFRVIYGLVADGSAYRSELRAASPASLLLPPLRLVLPWWSNHLRGRGFCLSLTARGSTHHLYICCPNKPPLYPHLNPASPSWHSQTRSL